MDNERNLEEQEDLLNYRRKILRKRQLRQQRRKISVVTNGCLLVLSLIVILLLVSGHHEKQLEKRLWEQAQKEKVTQLPAVKETESPAGKDVQSELSADKEDATCRIGSVGDVIMHLPVVKAYGGLEPGEHDFTPALETFRSAYESVDYMVANLETSLGGDEKEYSGFPNFNAPDEIAYDLHTMGVDLQLLANNHIYDNGKDGFFRTISVFQQAGIPYTGVRGNEADSKYVVQDINGIRIGMINYTYEAEQEGDRKSLNGNLVEESMGVLINSYEESHIETFYSEIAQIQQEMYTQGVEFVIVYMHWGNEYELEPNTSQKDIAARLCDMGIDAVIGAHPHVVQPVDVLVSSDGTHKMFCAYSLGNHLSNQRREKISSRPNGHTEDGLFIKLTISRTGGKVAITNIEAVPTYVYKSAVPKYYVIPIYQVDGIEEQTGLTGIHTLIQASYDRTMNIIGNSLEDAKWELGIMSE